MNFLIRGLLGTGATSTLRLDAQAKALGEWLRSRTTKVPRSLLTSYSTSELSEPAVNGDADVRW